MTSFAPSKVAVLKRTLEVLMKQEGRRVSKVTALLALKNLGRGSVDLVQLCESRFGTFNHRTMVNDCRWLALLEA